VHEAVVAAFTALGYETKHSPSGSSGFFHGTGHGLGLAVHEPPGMSSRYDTPLRRGTVVTVEPGLYYPGLGACRIEDVVQVTATAPKLLSKYSYAWEI
jgi:Xaa-Pro aminopeptidase